MQVEPALGDGAGRTCGRVTVVHSRFTAYSCGEGRGQRPSSGAVQCQAASRTTALGAALPTAGAVAFSSTPDLPYTLHCGRYSDLRAAVPLLGGLLVLGGITPVRVDELRAVPVPVTPSQEVLTRAA